MWRWTPAIGRWKDPNQRNGEENGEIFITAMRKGMKASGATFKEALTYRVHVGMAGRLNARRNQGITIPVDL